MRYLSILTFLITLFAAAPSHAGLYAKDFNKWEDSWSFDESSWDYVYYGEIAINNCKNNICDFELNSASGTTAPSSCEIHDGRIQINGNKGKLIAFDKDEEYIEGYFTDNIKTHVSECLQFELDEENAVLKVLSDAYCLKFFCGARTSIASQNYTSRFLKKKSEENKTYKTSYKCENLSDWFKIMVCQDEELAYLDLLLKETYDYRKATTGKKDMAEMDTWLQNYSSGKGYDKDYIDKIYRLAAVSTYLTHSQKPQEAVIAKSGGLNTLWWIYTDNAYGNVYKAEWKDYTPYAGNIDLKPGEVGFHRSFGIDNCKNNTCDFHIQIEMEGLPSSYELLFEGFGTIKAETTKTAVATNIIFKNKNIATSNTLGTPDEPDAPNEPDAPWNHFRSITETTCSFELINFPTVDKLVIRQTQPSGCKIPEYFFTQLKSKAREDFLLFNTSYDCYKAGNLAEKTVCAVETLANLDLELAKLYKDASAISPQIKASQKEWIKKKNSCKDKESCIEYEYKRRIIDLYKIIRTKNAKK
ncbi:MAG: hypothetical protein OEV59_07050 [Deltaproteobacteria bacterium]|nr:hypothetical protein [Deltaproteobacteria bacterium]